jgi:hypothetical protein
VTLVSAAKVTETGSPGPTGSLVSVKDRALLGSEAASVEPLQPVKISTPGAGTSAWSVGRGSLEYIAVKDLSGLVWIR